MKNYDYSEMGKQAGKDVKDMYKSKNTTIILVITGIVFGIPIVGFSIYWLYNKITGKKGEAKITKLTDGLSLVSANGQHAITNLTRPEIKAVKTGSVKPKDLVKNEKLPSKIKIQNNNVTKTFTKIQNQKAAKLLKVKR